MTVETVVKNVLSQYMSWSRTLDSQQKEQAEKELAEEFQSRADAHEEEE